MLLFQAGTTDTYKLLIFEGFLLVTKTHSMFWFWDMLMSNQSYLVGLYSYAAFGRFPLQKKQANNKTTKAYLSCVEWGCLLKARVGLFRQQPDFRILMSQKAMKMALRCLFGCDFSPFRNQTLTWSHPSESFVEVGRLHAEWLAKLAVVDHS